MNPVLKRTLTGLAIGAVVISAVLFAPLKVIKPVVAVLIALAVMEYAALLYKKLQCISMAFLAAFLAGSSLIASGLWFLPLTAGDFGNMMLLYVIMTVKFSDVGGFAFGLTSAKLMKGGNHKMCPTISPGKSWEGMFGSIFASSLVSCSFMGATGFGLRKSLLIGLAAAVFGTAGDLVESKFKRWVGVKDSSTMKITNGMGGILDMFDSLVLAPAVIYCLIDCVA